MIYKKFIFQLKSEYVCEMMEGDLDTNDCEYDVGKVISLIGKISLGITKLESTSISMLEVPKCKSLHYNIMGMILIFMLYSMILGMQNLIIKL